MSSFLAEFVRNCWDLVAEMAPYLLFGFAVAGILHGLIRTDQVRRWLGQPGFGAVLKAALVGVPMPLCSCSVIPVAASLRKSGASRGATASFLSSTPQTGVDSILATYSLLGGLFTLVRVLVAFISGFVSGLLVDRFSPQTKNQSTTPERIPTPLQPSCNPPCSPPSSSPCRRAPLWPPVRRRRPRSTTAEPRSFAAAVRYGLVTLPADLAGALLSGLLLAALITTLMPDHWLSGTLGSGWLSFALATLISLPLYVCATASIPMAYALMTAGLSPGAALVFLIVGPATNTATVVAVWGMLGRTATLLYIASLIGVSWTSGWLFNQCLSADPGRLTAHVHAALQPAWWQQACGFALLLVLGFAVWKNRATRKSRAPNSCCSR